MNSAVLLLITLVALSLGYFLYGRFLSRGIFGIDQSRTTPAHTKRDGIDFEPAKHWLILFGHHFSSICGAGPIVGPVLACAYWGWGPSVLWLVIGAIWMGAVSDFSSLFVSVRSEGKSIASIAKPEISPRARILFSVFIWLSLILVIAVFSIFAAKTFVAEPSAVIPSFGLIPTALLFGWLVYFKGWRNRTATPIGLLLLAAFLFIGNKVPIVLPELGGLSTESLWILIFLAYCFIASITPVQILLQPRDYLACFILFGVIVIGVTSIFVVHPPLQEASFIAFRPIEWGEAGPMVPMLFVTIACGAISGFHSLVSSGTTCKQISSEGHTCRVGYGGMMIECLVGVMVLICVSAALTRVELGSILRAGGPIAAFSEGYGKLSSLFLGDYGKSFAILALNAFILTTLDTATRITRYLTSELLGIHNKYLATVIVVVASASLALTGSWGKLWPAFGSSNQLIAGLSLLVASCWLLHRGKKILFTLIPSLLMLLITIGSFTFLIISSLTQGEPDFLVAGLSLGLILMALVVFWEGITTIYQGRVGSKLEAGKVEI